MKYFVSNRHDNNLVEISRETVIDLLSGVPADSLNLSFTGNNAVNFQVDEPYIELYIGHTGTLFVATPELSFNSSVVHRSLEPVQEFFQRFDRTDIDPETALETLELEALIAAVVDTQCTETKKGTIFLTLHSDPDTMAQLLEVLLFKPGLYHVESLTSTKATTEFSTIDTVAMHITKNRISAIGY